VGLVQSSQLSARRAVLWPAAWPMPVFLGQWNAAGQGLGFEGWLALKAKGTFTSAFFPEELVLGGHTQPSSLLFPPAPVACCLLSPFYPQYRKSCMKSCPSRAAECPRGTTVPSPTATWGCPWFVQHQGRDVQSFPVSGKAAVSSFGGRNELCELASRVLLSEKSGRVAFILISPLLKGVC